MSSPLQALAFARALAIGTPAPRVALLLGDDGYLRDAAMRAIEKSVVEPALRDFNVERFTAGECPVSNVISAARMAPMMAARRLVAVRSLERWEADGAAANLDVLSDYAKEAVDTTCLVLLAERMHGSRRLVTLAKKEGWHVDCMQLPEDQVAQVVTQMGELRQKKLSPALARALVERVGCDLATLEDAVERMSLFAGSEEPSLSQTHMLATVVRLQQGDTWDLVAAVGTRDAGAALVAFANSFEPKDRGLPLVGALAWSLRQLLRVHEGVAQGMAPDAAARAAGAYSPQKSRELVSTAKRFSRAELSEFLCTLAVVDRELKGAKRSPRSIIESALLRFAVARS